MKFQNRIGNIECESSRVRDRVRRAYRGHRSGTRTLGLILSFLVAAGTAELTTGAVTIGAPQTANSLDTTSQPSVKPTAQDWQPEIVVRVHNYSQIEAGVLLVSRL